MLSFVTPVNLYFIVRISCPNVQGFAIFAIQTKYFPRLSKCYLSFNNDNNRKQNKNTNNMKCIFPETCQHIQRPAPAPNDLTVVHALWPEMRTNQTNQEVLSNSVKAQIYGKGTKRVEITSTFTKKFTAVDIWRVLSPFRFRIFFFFTPSPTTRSTK